VRPRVQQPTSGAAVLADKLMAQRTW